MDLNVECSAVMNIMAVGRASRSINDIGAALTKATLDVSKFAEDDTRNSSKPTSS